MAYSVVQAAVIELQRQVDVWIFCNLLQRHSHFA